MGVLDILLLLCLVPAAWEGIAKGFAIQLIMLASVILGVIAAKAFSDPVTQWMVLQFGGNPAVMKIASYAVIFLVAMLILRIFGEVVTRLIKAITLGWVNRLLGLIFGVVKAGLILGLLIVLFDKLNGTLHLVQTSALDASPVYVYLRDTTQTLFPHLKQFFTDFTIN